MYKENQTEYIKTLQEKFKDPAIEKLYQFYSISCKKSQLFPCFLFGIFLYNITQIGIHLFWWKNLEIDKSSNYIGYLIYISTILLLNTIGLISSSVLLLMGSSSSSKLNSIIVSHLACCLWSITIILSIILRMDESIPLRIGLGWIILEIFLIFITLPVTRKIALVYSIVLGIFHTVSVIWKGRAQQFFFEQLTANFILIFGTNILGVIGFNMNEKKQRIAFDDSRQSLEVKDVMESHVEEQQRLFLSVLPKHLAETMTQDSENSNDGSSGFKKIYMERHEPVSILFADIVGFTAMSAALGSASKLVEILDELFSMFDSLAEKYSQVRIKILGDCYYCICGAPEERPDHAILCVHMGLAVVEAIKYFQKRTNTAVDMRVGIHTGAVLAGILGQRQWQFDVYSKDVDLANLMESGGIPGKVHVSDKTLSYLNGEFEVESGFGENREEGLRMAGIKTYFITKVLKNFQEKSTNGTVTNDDQGQRKMGKYNERLKIELLSQDGDKKINERINKITLKFVDKTQEHEFSTKTEESNDGISAYIGSCCTLISFTSTSFLVISFQLVSLLTSMIGLIILCILGSISQNSKNLISPKNFFKTNTIKNFLGLIAIIVLTITNIILMIPCFQAGRILLGSWNSTTYMEIENWAVYECNYPVYLIIYCGFFLLSITLFSNIYFWYKTGIIFLVLMIHVVLLNASSLMKTFQCSEIFSFKSNDIIPEIYFWNLFMFIFLCALISLSHRLELSIRIRFLSKSNVIQQKERSTALKLKNEVLMCNIMPQHVANHFLKSKNKNKGLYSENYLETGVIFAAMPNFGDFYTEDAVNNQGLECLRFLNEVISDYDVLLDLPKYNGEIIKIKTIGSTYMAASGLNPLKQSNPEDPLKERWRHLSLLVEFAFDMKKVLNQINEQSYNQFVLKIGINHGPITAGVIGNTKPAYDIWGNTANVSSRMYSTGKADKIQVTDETYKILRMYGYQFERRGFISVKGKGEILTYFLTGIGMELTEEQILELDET